jgi:hypothetical protein
VSINPTVQTKTRLISHAPQNRDSTFLETTYVDRRDATKMLSIVSLSAVLHDHSSAILTGLFVDFSCIS